MTDIAALRHEAFVTKLAVHRIATFYNEVRRADLTGRFPQTQDTLTGIHLRNLFEQFDEASRRMETALHEEMVRLSVEAEWAVNAYAKAYYGFTAGDDIEVTLPGGLHPVNFRVLKIFLQSGTDSDIRVDGIQLNADGTSGVRWDLFMSGPGELQTKKCTRKARQT
jgi:hypothetical protein